MEGWFDLRESNNVIDSEANKERPVIHFMDAKNTADNIVYSCFLERLLIK